MKLDLPDFRRWLAIGTGAGIPDGRVGPVGSRGARSPHRRPGPGSHTIPRFRERRADDWGAEYAGVSQEPGSQLPVGHGAAAASDLIVRQLALGGVANRDLGAAIQFQLDALHPYGEDEAAYSWCRLGRSGAVLIAILRREILERYTALFSEAGVKVAGFTFSAAAVHSGVRLLGTPPRAVLWPDGMRRGSRDLR